MTRSMVLGSALLLWLLASPVAGQERGPARFAAVPPAPLIVGGPAAGPLPLRLAPSEAGGEGGMLGLAIGVVAGAAAGAVVWALTDDDHRLRSGYICVPCDAAPYVGFGAFFGAVAGGLVGSLISAGAG